MDIMLRHGVDLNIKWPLTISLFFHIILITLLSYNVFTKTSALNSMHTPFSAVQVNIVNFPTEGSSTAMAEKTVSSKQVAAGFSLSSKEEVRNKKSEIRSQKQETRSQKSEIRSKREDTAKNSGTIPAPDAKKQSSGAVSPNPNPNPNHDTVLKTAPFAGTLPAASISSAGSAPGSGSAKGGAGAKEASLTTGTYSQNAGPAVDVPDFKYDYYLGLIRNKVDSRWNQPVTYSQVKKAVVEFTILRNGKIDGVKVSESSGDYYFDQTAVRAVSVSNPFPPLPKGYKDNSLRVRYKFIFGGNG